MKLKNNIKLLITCDSGAAAGKTTASKYISKKFKLNLLTSGLLYRYVAYKLITFKKNPSDSLFLIKIIKNIKPQLLKNNKLYSVDVTKFTSEIAKIKKVRKLLKKYQEKFASKRLATNEYRAELDRQVQAKLNAARQKMASTSTTPSTTTLPKKSYGTTPSPRRMSPEDYRSALDSQVEAKLAALRREVEVENKMYGVSSNGNNPSLSAVPSYVQSSLETRTTSRSNMMAQQQQYQQQSVRERRGE